MSYSHSQNSPVRQGYIYPSKSLERRPHTLPEWQLLLTNHDSVLVNGETLLVQINPAAAVEIDIEAVLEGIRLAPDELADEVDNAEEREQDVGVDEVTGVEGRQVSPALHEREEDAGAQTEPGSEGVGHGDVRELLDATTAKTPATAEANVNKADATPDEKRADTREVDNVAVGASGTGADVHHGDCADGVCEEDGGDGDATLGADPAKDFGCLAGLRHVQNSA